MTRYLRAPLMAQERRMTCALVIDAHPVVHLGCGQMLVEAGFDEVLAAAAVGAGLDTARTRQPDLAIVEAGLPGVGALAMIASLRRAAPDMRILVYATDDRPALAARVLAAGAHGFLSKQAAPEHFREAVATVRAGEIYLDHPTALTLATRRGSAAASPVARLSPREREVLFKLGDGLDLSRIAEELGVSYKTAANTSSALKKKLGSKGLNDLIRIAIENAGDRDLPVPAEP